MPELMQIIPKTTYEFDGRANSTQTIILKERIPVVAFGSGVLVVRVHDITGWTTSASAAVAVRAQSVSQEDPGTEFVIESGAALASVTINDDDTTPELLVDAFDADAPMLRALIAFSQGATAAGDVQSLTLGVDLVLREVK